MRIARRYFFGFIVSVIAEGILAVWLFTGTRDIMNTSSDKEILTLLTGYIVPALFFAAVLLYCLIRSKEIQKATGKTRWSI